jgi:hypothetical protein
MHIPIFAHISALSYLIPAYFGIRAWKQLNLSQQIFSSFLIFTIFVEALELILALSGIHNQFVLNYHQIIEFICVMFLFFSWTKNQRLKKGIQYITILNIVVWLIYKLYFENPDKFSEVITPLANIFFIIVSIISIVNLTNKVSFVTVATVPMFWFSLGIALYASGTFGVQLLSNVILEKGIQYFAMLWYINWGFSIIANLCYAKGFSVAKNG